MPDTGVNKPCTDPDLRSKGVVFFMESQIQISGHGFGLPEIGLGD